VFRWKFLLAKYIAILTSGLAILAVFFLANILFVGFFFGFEGIGAPLLSVANGNVINASPMFYMVSRYLFNAIGMVVLATFSFALSTLARSSALAIGLGVTLYFVGFILVETLQMMGFYQAQYILFANTNLVSVMAGTTLFFQHTLTFAIINIAVYMFVFLLTAYDAFVKRDIQ
jgi:ABC-2 type transport system permease protein